ncbi:Spy/CpxP family protein refolding chaperone [Pseudoalteromonas sp. T1lg23B]|uniref:Spy/CpxP family protein refolding chaperone n=1 Tax=Pseudoalteromonas sp. T1lg23B TaxID=2077097 RepID=UPI000CF6A63D|nr:Spy/CpxP family protein refolding chaperone [Pseudoalteromonas sp. T1lg23B]
MKVTSTLSVLALTGTLLFTSLAQAGHGHHDKHFLLTEKAAAKLNLTQAQQDKIAQILEQKKTAMKALKTSRVEHKDEFKALMENDYFDEQQAKALIAKRSEAKNEALLAKLKSKHQIRQVLNQEQRDKLAKMKHREMERHHKMESN